MSASARDIARNPVKEKLARGEVVVSMAVRIVPGVEIVRIAKSAGFDMLYVDLEHSAFSIADHQPDSIMGAGGGHAGVRARAGGIRPTTSRA